MKKLFASMVQVGDPVESLIQCPGQEPGMDVPDGIERRLALTQQRGSELERRLLHGLCYGRGGAFAITDHSV